MFHDFHLLFFIVPALLLGSIAQATVRYACANSSRQESRMSGYAAARHVLDGAGLYDIAIEQVPGHLSDHYDRSQKTLRLSSQIYHGRNLMAVGISAHEAGHALQDATGYRPLVIRNAAVPASSFGSGAGILMAALGLILRSPQLLALGGFLFAAMVGLQVLNLPVEINASTRAQRSLVNLGIVNEQEVPVLRKALNAGALALLAGTLQSILTLAHYASSLFGQR